MSKGDEQMDKRPIHNVLEAFAAQYIQDVLLVWLKPDVREAVVLQLNQLVTHRNDALKRLQSIGKIKAANVEWGKSMALELAILSRALYDEAVDREKDSDDQPKASAG